MNREPIAIVGTACRFPGPATNIRELWNLLLNPYDISSEVPSDRFNIDAFHHPNPEHHGTFNTRRAYFLKDDFRKFDASFFHIHPREAETMDPQQRMLLETVFEAMEAGGHSIESMQGSQTAVFVGGMSCDFRDTLAIRDPASIPEYSATGTHDSILAARVSYFFDWKGPCMSIDTACSSSLVAVHQAVQALRNGDATAAVVAGSNLNIGPEQFIALSNLRMLSPNGRVAMWDKDADGYARGEGFGAIILKTLTQAKADGDEIECVIRESGVNQDGKTTGITMPNAMSQAHLIREVYKRAGLDTKKLADQPQYFEAHGTGTPAGDPIEAKAILDTFSTPMGEDADPLFVGSIKTVIGHLEGAAGIAGLIKGSLAVQHGVIPPNLHFKELNPKIAAEISSHNGKLQVPTEAHPWPERNGLPRRASVNSFGFGGTNAHIILESYESKPLTNGTPTPTALPILITPLIVSAKSNEVLTKRIHRLADFIENKGIDVNLEDLAYTLQSRTSQFSAMTIFSEPERDEVVSAMRKIDSTSNNHFVLNQSEPSKPQVLGIFTGQGAQNAGMGEPLIKSSAAARDKIKALEIALASLPDPPSWSIAEELAKPTASSRIGIAALSQPLCTALQMVIVDHLHAAGVQFDAVVGHSSGEIAAAYAAGLLTARDAICIAYYRGLYAHLAQGSDGQKGGMLAVGMSFQESQVFCRRPQFHGRISVAASNSPSNSTLSGDVEAIEEALAALGSTNTFARRLAVDTAYHSHHMQTCSSIYKNKLNELGLDFGSGSSKTRFISSVHDSDLTTTRLDSSYWKENMAQPVLFSQALERAVRKHGSFDIAVEVGPHPALKGPATETLSIQDAPVKYRGTLRRSYDAVQSLSECLGFLYQHLGPKQLRFDAYRNFFLGDQYRKPKLVTGLPSYPWDHDRILYRESGMSRRYLHDSSLEHGLLGRRVPDSSTVEWRWRNVISLKEVLWISDHKVDRQPVVAAMWYVAMALEAAMLWAEDDMHSVSKLELQDFKIEKALVVENNSPVETIFSFRTDSDRRDNVGEHQASFSCSAGPLYGGSTLNLIFNGHVTITFSDDCESTTPGVEHETMTGAVQIKPNAFYEYLERIGYSYSGPFRNLGNINKKGRYVQATARNEVSKWVAHPATLDLALQVMLAAHFNTDDDGMALVVPQGIRRMILYPKQCMHEVWELDVEVTQQTHAGICGDVEMTTPRGALIGFMEGVTWKPLALSTPAQDRKMFYTTIWDTDIHDGASSTISVSPYTEQELALVTVCDRAALYYYRMWTHSLTQEEWSNAEPHHHRLCAYIERVLARSDAGEIPTLEKSAVLDSKTDIQDLLDSYKDSPDLRLIQTVGENLPTSIREKRPMLEFMMQDGVLSNYYKHGLGYEKCYELMRGFIRKIVHRYPRMRVLEIGAGTGGATSHVLSSIDNRMLTYTYTDVSSGFFERAREVFSEYETKMVFRTLDLEKDFKEQGFEDAAYEFVIGSLVVHATKSIRDTLQSLRRLLRPGGYLLLIEGSADTIRSGFVMSGLPGWWVGGDKRPWGPMEPLEKWDQLLKETGFSGLDVCTKDNEKAFTNLGAVFISQAVDETVEFLRSPLVSLPPCNAELVSLVVLGPEDACKEVTKFLPQPSKNLLVLNDLDQLPSTSLPKGSTVLVLSELNEPLFKSISPSHMRGLQNLCSISEKILIILREDEVGGAYAHAFRGLVRSIRLEVPHLRVQTLSLKGSDVDYRRIAETFLRLAVSNNADDVLWSFEPELELVDGVLRIPRIVEDTTLNNRLNSSRRMITEHVSPGKEKFRIVRDEENSSRLRLLRDINVGTEMAKRSLSYSSVDPLHIGGKPWHASFRKTQDGPNQLIFCEVAIPTMKAVGTVHHHETSTETEIPAWLAHVAISLFAQECLASARPGCLILLHEPDEPFKQAFEHATSQSSRKDTELVHSSSVKKAGYIHLPSPISARQIRELFPRRGTTARSVLLIDCSRLLNVPQSAFPNVTLVTPFTRNPSADWPTMLDIPTALCKAADFADQRASPSKNGVAGLTVIPAATLSSVGVNRGQGLHIIDWTSTDPVPVQIQSVTESFDLFRGDRTYLLVGLTGAMGRVLAEWMVEHEARFIVLASRNPTPDPAWENAMQRRGATVKFYQMDVCSKQAVQDARSSMEGEKLPPLAGIANGAMVLRDSSFFEMSHTQMKECLGPKVDGSMYLDEVFGHLPLDFFIMFSSLAFTLGNPGQANYAAANGFMAGLAHARRHRGRPASIISLGVVGGVGYLARTRGGRESEHAKRRNVMTISPEELCTVFAEGVVAGRWGGDHGVELITGLDGRIDTRTTDKDSLALWLSDPRVSHIIRDRADELVPSLSGKPTATEGKIPLNVQLRHALASGGHDDALSILTQHFAKKLERMLLMSPGKLSSSVPLVDMGVDSLLAIEIRSWFYAQLGVDIPVLKVLANTHCAAIAKYALELLLAAATSMPGRHPTDTASKATNGATAPLGNDTTRQEVASFAQARMYRLHQFTDGIARVNNMSWSYTIRGPLDVDRLERALHATLQPFEALRTRFYEQDGQVMQEVLPAGERTILPLEHTRLATDAEVDAFWASFADAQHDPSTGRLVQAAIVEQSPTKHVLAMSFHHIGVDTRSCEILLSELDRAYASPSTYRSPYADDAGTQPVVYAALQTQALKSGAWTSSIDFWREHLHDATLVLPLFPSSSPTTVPPKQRKAMHDYKLSSYIEYLTPTHISAIQTACKDLKCSPYHLHTSLLAILLTHLTNLQDVVIGSVDAGRDASPAYSDAFGPMFNYLPLHIRDVAGTASGRQRFRDLVRRARDTAYAVRAHAQVPFDVVVEAVGEERMPATHHPVYQAQINYLRHTIEEVPLGALTLELRDARGVDGSYDFCVSVLEGEREVRVAFQCQEYLYGGEETKGLGRAYLRLLEAVLEDVDVNVGDLV